jgi:hypothetical protein
MRNYVFLNIRKAFERTTELVSISPTFYEQTFRTKVFYADFFYLQFCFVIICLKNICKKADHEMLVKLTTDERSLERNIKRMKKKRLNIGKKPSKFKQIEY